MAFSRGPMRAPTPTRTRGAVFAVGRLVHVASSTGRSMPVTLTDDTGDKPLASLGDGTEVAIVAWRPNGATGTRYCVRTTDSAVEGWLPVGNLRGKELPIVAPTPKPPIGTVSAAPPLRVGARRASRPVGARRSAL
jgi:hypothetical protein